LARSGWNPPAGRHGTALVVMDDDRAALATTLVLQEMGMTVDIAADRDAAIEWIEDARYSLIVCSGADQDETTNFVLRVRYLSRRSRIVLLASAGYILDGLEILGIEVLQGPMDVNRLISRVMPAAA